MTEPQLSLLERARLFRAYAYVAEPNWDVLRLFAQDEFAALKVDLARATRAELVARMERLARAVFEECFADSPRDIVIPLSGGRDSRLILCMALECGLRERIVALTWGVPGGLDFELAGKVAARLGVRHVRIDTTAQQIGFSDLKRAYDRGARWTDLTLAHFNQLWRTAAPGARAVVGYLGGPVMGGHYAAGHERRDFASAIAAFEALNRRRPGRARMIGDVAQRLLSPDLLSLPEQLDLVYRQEGYLRRVVAPATMDLRAPLAHPDWMRFGYALPAWARTGANLFTDFLLRRFPHAFGVGTANAYGLRANASAFERRTARRLLRARYEAANVLRRRGFVSFGKYGDARDLAAVLVSQQGEPGAYVRALRRRPPRDATERTAADWRSQAMMICNLACAAQEQATADMRAA